MKKTLLALAVSALVISAPASAEFLDFTINEGSVPDAFANTFTADYLNGSYNEVYSITSSASGLNFATSAYAEFTAILQNEGTQATNNQLGTSQFNANLYSIYATFTATGTVTNNGGVAQFNGQAGTFDLFIDADSNTTKALGANGSSAVVLGNTDDDYKIASSTTLLSLANVFGNPGAFDLWFGDFTLTAAGALYFIEPNPFHLITNVDGDFNNINFDSVGTELATTGEFTRTVNGDVSAVFVNVPEPASLALLGLGLAGLGLTARRRKAA